MADIILVAEDDKFLANAYTLKLRSSGHDVDVVYNGEDAIQKLKENKYDAVILDIIMPRQDGFAVLKTMRQDKNFDNVPVIVASNLGQEDDVNRAMSLGANDYIVKSNVSLTELMEKLNRILAMKHEKDSQQTPAQNTK